MKKEYKILLSGALSICVVDLLGALASRQLVFNYIILLPVSIILYGFFGFIATKEWDLKIGIITSATIGLVDSTIGWKISMLVNANTGTIKNYQTASEWLFTIIVVTCLAAFCGLIGGSLTKFAKKRN